MKNIIIACGGTGGHLTPGIALAQSLEQMGCSCWLFISQKKVDSRLSSKYPKLSFVHVHGTPCIKTPLGILRFFKEVLLSFLQTRKFIRKVGADALIGFGGFSTFGPALATLSCRLPFHLHEANRVIGKAVSFLAHRAEKVYLPEGVLLKGLASEKLIHLGYPLRTDFRKIPMERARQRLGIPMKDRLLVILGGSQGAVALNEWVKENLEELAMDGISVYCLTGMQKQSCGVVQLEGIGGDTITSRFVDFSDQVNVVLSAANLVISRSGAGAIAEIICCRVPAIFVPYPFAADNHQHANGTYLEAKGGAVVCDESCIKEQLLDEVRELMFNEEFRSILMRNLYALDRGDMSLKLARNIVDSLNQAKQNRSPRPVLANCL